MSSPVAVSYQCPGGNWATSAHSSTSAFISEATRRRPSRSWPQYSGTTPIGSRAMMARPLALSHRAKAKMPLSRLRNEAGASSRYSALITSQSEAVRNAYGWRSSSFSRAWL